MDYLGKMSNIDDLSESEEALKNNRSLKKIDFSSNNLGDEGAKILADILAANNMKLTELFLINCKIKGKEVECLASVLKNNNTLKDFYLESNEIGDQGAKHLALLLEANNTLEGLAINDNQITDIGAELFIKVLKGDTSIQFIELDYNEINDKLLQDIQGALKTIPENLVQEELVEQSEEIEFNNKRTIDTLEPGITQEEPPNKKIKSEDTSQLPIQTELAGDDSSSDSCVSDLEL